MFLTSLWAGLRVGEIAALRYCDVVGPNGRVLAEVRATPCAWLGVDVAGFDPLTVYGFYKDFSIDIAYFYTSRCNLEIEGLI